MYDHPYFVLKNFGNTTASTPQTRYPKEFKPEIQRRTRRIGLSQFITRTELSQIRILNHRETKQNSNAQEINCKPTIDRNPKINC